MGFNNMSDFLYDYLQTFSLYFSDLFFNFDQHVFDFRNSVFDRFACRFTGFIVICRLHCQIWICKP